MRKIFLTLVAFISMSVQAQETSTPTSGQPSMKLLTLKECKRLAVENNIALRSARNSISQAEEQQKEAYTNYFPQVSAMGAGMMADKHLMQMDLNMPAELSGMLPEGVFLPSSMGMVKHGVLGSLSVMQPVYAGGRIANGNKLAKMGLEASRIQMETAEDEVELNTEQYYWQVVSLKEKLVTLASLHDMLKQLEKDVTVSVNAGVTTRNDLLQVQLQVNEIESQTLQVNNGLEICRQLLAQYIGKNGESIDVETKVEYDVQPLQPKRQDHSAALPTMAQYRLLEKNVEATDLQCKMKVGENLPTVSAGAVYTYNNLMGDGRGVGMLMATVSIPISSWWGGTHAVRRQKLAAEQAREDMVDVSEKLYINMNNCWANVETSLKQLSLAKKSIEQAQENLRLNNNFYRAGTTTMSELLDAQSNYQQSRDKYVDSYIDYQVNLLKYHQSVGLDAND